MYKIVGNTIYLTRGNTFDATITIKQGNTSYVPQVGDSIEFALKRSELNHNKTEYLDEEPLIVKVIPTDTLALRLDSADTKPLKFGEYDYDITITMEDGTVDTFISDKIHIEKEVH